MKIHNKTIKKLKVMEIPAYLNQVMEIPAYLNHYKLILILFICFNGVH